MIKLSIYDLIILQEYFSKKETEEDKTRVEKINEHLCGVVDNLITEEEIKLRLNK